MEYNAKKVFKSLGPKLYNKFQLMNYSNVNKMIGFMDEFKKFKIVFKIKLLQRTSSGRLNKGKRCGTEERKILLK